MLEQVMKGFTALSFWQGEKKINQKRKRGAAFESICLKQPKGCLENESISIPLALVQSSRIMKWLGYCPSQSNEILLEAAHIHLSAQGKGTKQCSLPVSSPLSQ